MEKKNKHLELVIALLLSFSGGFGDGYTFLYRGGIFAYMHTGNLVKFLIALVNGSFEFKYFIPIILFLLGIIIAVILNKNKDRSLAILILMAISFLGVGFLPNTPVADIICVSILSITGAMQYQTFRRCLGNYYSSTMCANNMRLFSEGIVNFIDDRKNKKFLFYFLILTAFSLGVVASILLGKVFEYYTISFLAIISSIIIVFQLLLQKNIQSIKASSLL